jgi:hypothetical protein
MTRKAIEATKDDVPFAALGGSKRAPLLVASPGASDVRTLAQEEEEEEAAAADIDAETIPTRADEALVLG